MKSILLVFAIGLGLAAMPLIAQDARPGIADQPAPAWGVTEWLNLPKACASTIFTSLRRM